MHGGGIWDITQVFGRHAFQLVLRVAELGDFRLVYFKFQPSIMRNFSIYLSVVIIPV